MSVEQRPNPNKEQGMNQVEQLVQEYRNFAASHDEGEINEERVKIAFIVPLLEALGWNMRTDEVLPEQRTLTGEADFGLRVYGATPQVYVECKPFRESLDGHRVERGRQVTYAEKAIQYAWSMKANWAILTNFKKLRLYYTLVRKPSEGLVFPEISFEEYTSRFDELWLLSKDSIASGAIETYRKKATRNYVDEEFLKDLIECRQLLLDNIQANNPTLAPDEVNESAQRILDRVIFVRSCEDRGIVPSEMLWKHYLHWQEVAIDKTVRTFMIDLKNMFRDIDRAYNGKLFEPHLCEDLRIDNSVFQAILERLYGDGGRTGYRFDAIPINVLGQAYELYIGSVIVEKTGAAKGIEIVEDYKKRQEHGIYYTPVLVTHFIVRRTLGEILKRTRNGDDVLRVKLLDQAAGSGSFLIESFDQFRQAYDAYKISYEQDMLRAPLSVRLAQPEWIEPEKAILQNNLYGVDMDPQAVEIATLNLELKAVKAKGRIPNLGEHVRRGNSIISHNADELLQKFEENELKQLLGQDWRSEWQHKHPFNYHEAFKEIMQTGGFDIIVGNPPYNNMRDPELKVEQAYCKRFHDDIFRGNSDILFYFVENGLSILKHGGFLGLIVARYFMKSEEADLLRKHILTHSRIHYIVDTRNLQIFGRVNVLTCIIILERDDSPGEAKSSHKIKVVNVKDTFKGTPEQLFERIDRDIEKEAVSNDWIDVFEIEQGTLTDKPWTLEPPAAGVILRKIRKGTWSLGDIADVGVGFDTGLNVARLDAEKDREDAAAYPVFILSEQEASRLRLEKTLLVKMVKGLQVQRYALLDKGFVMVNTSEKTDIEEYPRIKAHLSRFRQQLEARHKYKTGVCPWYGIGLRQNEEILSQRRKILVPKYATGNKFAYDNGTGFYCTSDVYAIAPRAACPIDLRYVLGILNSRLMEFYHTRVTKLKRDGYYEYFAEQLRRLPIKRVDLRKTDEKATHDNLVHLVGKLVDAKNRVLLIEKSFAEQISLHPSEERLSRLRTYFEYDEIRPNVLGGFNREKGTVCNFDLSRNGRKIRIFVDCLPADSDRGLLTRTPALDLDFEDELLGDFVYYSLRKFMAESSKRTLGRGNILKTLQTQIVIPCFFGNHKDNAQVIRKIMNHVRAGTKKLLAGHETLEELEDEIQALDEAVEKEVRELYNITADEEAIIRSAKP